MCSNASLVIALVFCILHNQNGILGNLKLQYSNHNYSQSVLIITQRYLISFQPSYQFSGLPLKVSGLNNWIETGDQTMKTMTKDGKKETLIFKGCMFTWEHGAENELDLARWGWGRHTFNPLPSPSKLENRNKGGHHSEVVQVANYSLFTSR